MPQILLLCTPCLLGLGGPTSDKAELARALEAIYAPLEDVTCEYEGKMTFPQTPDSEDLGPEGLFDDFSGVFVGRRDGAVLVDIYHRYYPKRQIYRETIALRGDKCEVYSRSVDDTRGGGTISAAHFLKTNKLGSLTRIICDNVINGYINHEDWSMKGEGAESIDGHRCEIVSFSYSRDPRLRDRFWIDLERGGHALKWEALVDGAVANRASNIVLKRFKDGRGVEVWLPVSGTFEAFGDSDRKGNVTYGNAATNRETYAVLEESIRLNTHPKDEQFSVKFRNGALITDKLRRTRFEFGQAHPAASKPLTRAETEAMLKEQVRLAESQGDELKASSWERSGSGWIIWASWITAASALAFLVFLFLRQRS